MSNHREESSNNEIERLRIKYGFLKFILGTFVISVLSIVINWQIQEKRLEYEIQAKESEYIAQFLEHGLEDELEKRRDFAAYFVRLSPSTEARLRWQDYLDFIEELISQAKAAEIQIAQKDRELEAAAAKIAELQKEAEAARTELTKLEPLVEKGERDAGELEKYRTLAESRSAEAKQFHTKLEDIQNTLVVQRKELASIRTKPFNLEVRHPVTVGNIASMSEKTKDYWDWTVFLKGDEDMLAQIKYVEYTLHPTFPNPIRIVKERGAGPYPFPLSTSGWGTFTIKVKVYYNDGTYQSLTHHLSFDESKRPDTQIRRTLTQPRIREIQ